MFKAIVKSQENQLGIGDGFLVPSHRVNTLIGELLTLIEVLGLTVAQEKSLKDLIKQKIWEHIRDAKWVDSDAFTSLHFLMDKIGLEASRRANKDSLNVATPSFVKGVYEMTFTETE